MNPHLFDKVDEINFRMKGADAARRYLRNVAKQRQVLSLEFMSARSKCVQSLSIQEKNRLLTLMDDELRAGVEIL